MMKLRDYLTKLRTDKEMAVGDRILYLYDTENNNYFSQVLVLIYVDTDEPTYRFAPAEPNVDFDRLNVIRAYTVDNCMNVMMGIEHMWYDCVDAEEVNSYGESYITDSI